MKYNRKNISNIFLLLVIVIILLYYSIIEILQTELTEIQLVNKWIILIILEIGYFLLILLYNKVSIQMKQFIFLLITTVLVLITFFSEKIIIYQHSQNVDTIERIFNSFEKTSPLNREYYYQLGISRKKMELIQKDGNLKSIKIQGYKGLYYEYNIIDKYWIDLD